MLGGYISVFVFISGMLCLTGAAMLLTPLVRRFAKRPSQVFYCFLLVSLLVFAIWQAITWTTVVWLAVAPLLSAAVLTLVVLFGDQGNSTAGHVLRGVGILLSSLVASFFLGQTALEVGLTTKQPVIGRSVTTIEFTIEYQGRDYPASFSRVTESVVQLHTRRDSWFPRLYWPANSLNYTYPRIESDLPFELYFSGAESVGLQRIRKGQGWVNGFPRSFANVDIVSCLAETCERVNTSVKPVGAAIKQRFNTFAKTDVVTHSEAYAFKATLAGSKGQPQEVQFSMKNPIGRRYYEPIVETEATGNAWLLFAWGKFPLSHKEKCNNFGYLSYWNLCTISEATWDQIRSNQRVSASREN